VGFTLDAIEPRLGSFDPQEVIQEEWAGFKTQCTPTSHSTPASRSFLSIYSDQRENQRTKRKFRR
jgi:hypothetical protein